MDEEEKTNFQSSNAPDLDDEDEDINKFETEFVSFDDGTSRLRPEVLDKDADINFKQKLEDVKEFFVGCFQKCNLCKDDPSQIDTTTPPKRCVYWGPAYDIRSNAEHDNQTTVRPPHIESDQYDNDDELQSLGSKFVSNYISTTKYSLISFLPVNLFEQFKKKANFYFLIIAILAFTDLSPKSAVFSVTPLTLVLAVSAIKEAYEDYKRYEMDKEINNRQVDVCRPDEEGKNWCFKKLAWEELQVGDCIRITKDSRAFPADFLLLQSSTNQGLCNIETANLDGETNLKIKQAVGATYSLPTDEEGDYFPFNGKLQFKLESEAPHENIGKWVGALYMSGDKEPIPVGMNQFILRGCTLRNTDWIIGVVVFTGVETKISLNNKESKFKRSNVDVIVDRVLYFIFGMQQIMCIFGIISHLLWLQNEADDQWYQYTQSDGSPQDNYGELAALNYFTFLVLLDLFVPISLYVSMEMVKFTQAALIAFDKDMMCKVEDETNRGLPPTKIYAQARTSNLNEELGQVSFIFSDKTGTLTENKMAFLKCHVDGVRYGPEEMNRQNEHTERIALPSQDLPPFDTSKCLFTDNRLAKRSQSNPQINGFLTLLSVCHSIIPEYPDGKDGDVIYNASSPDEKALVLLAKNMHYYFYDGHVQILEFDGYDAQIDGHRFGINIFGRKLQFDVFNMLEFTSKRKRMSVICRDPRDGKMKLYCKGADNVIYQRLKREYKPGGGNKRAESEWNKTMESLQFFAADGLRTLVCGYKEIDDGYFVQWLVRLNHAKSAMQNRDILVEECYDEIECDLSLLGATAIEDKLQDGVASAIANLAVAGISIWVLTGDKVETAINIGRSCRLLSARMNREDGSLFVVDPDERMEDKECEGIVKKAFLDAWAMLEDHEDNDPNQGFVISGKALQHVFPSRKHDSRGREIPPSAEAAAKEEDMQQQILQILRKCRSVICCRVSPIQKAQMVGLVKQNVDGVITLAIGDGANDVPMIRAAHVGIGISGQEGLQAVMASDYAIAQFRFLQDLLLVHGAWDYRRTSVLILYSFYKNIMFSMTQIWFSFYCGFSGTLFYDQFSGSLYNLFFTALPVLLGAVFDRPYSKEIAKLCPELYENGPRNASFNLKIFGIYCAEGVLHSIIVFWTAIQFIDSQSKGSNGQIVGFWTTNTTMFTSIVLIATLKMMLETRTWTNWSIIAFALSLFLWFLWLLVYAALPLSAGFANQDIYGVPQMGMSMPQWWFIIILASILSLAPEILYKYIQRMYVPTRLDVIEELEAYPSKRKQFISEIHTYQQKEKQISDQQHTEDAATAQQTHLGFSEFQVGKDHPDYVMSQHRYMNLAMKKPRFSHLRKILKKKSANQQQRTNVAVTSTIPEERPGGDGY
eukprot:496795_1